jgi:hypothetical protein
MADMKEARTAWQGLAGTRQAKKGGTGIPLKAETSVEILKLEKMLAAINEHPGITLAGIASRLGVAPVVLGRVSKSLLDKGEIRKDGKLYFPVSAK